MNPPISISFTKILGQVRSSCAPPPPTARRLSARCARCARPGATPGGGDAAHAWLSPSSWNQMTCRPKQTACQGELLVPFGPLESGELAKMFEIGEKRPSICINQKSPKRKLIKQNSIYINKKNKQKPNKPKPNQNSKDFTADLEEASERLDEASGSGLRLSSQRVAFGISATPRFAKEVC